MASQVVVRLSTGQRATLDALGGDDWLRERIDCARVQT